MTYGGYAMWQLCERLNLCSVFDTFRCRVSKDIFKSMPIKKIREYQDFKFNNPWKDTIDFLLQDKSVLKKEIIKNA